MAAKATIYKADLAVSDIDRHYFANHTLTLACHPSETQERLMVRLLAFALFASDSLSFTRGLSTEDEPDVWDKDLTGRITHWIELGTPDESRIRKGCGRADRLTVISYNPRTALPWWDKVQSALQRFEHARVLFLPADATDALTVMAQRNMTLQATIQEGQVWFSDDTHSTCITPVVWKSAATG